MLLEAERRKCEFLERVGAAERARRLGPRRGAGDRLGRRRASRRRSRRRRRPRSGACRSSARAARSCSGSARRAEPRPRRRGRGAARRRARRGAGRASSSSARPARRRPGFPRRPGVAQEAPARAEREPCSVRRLPLDWPVSARQGLRVREPEGRRRQDDDRDQPRRVPRRGGRARARRRPRPAGERDLGARHARERHLDATTCSTARRSPSSRSRRAFANLFLVPSKPELAGAAVELSQRDGRRALPRRGAAARRGLRLRAARLPAVARRR